MRSRSQRDSENSQADQDLKSRMADNLGCSLFVGVDSQRSEAMASDDADTTLSASSMEVRLKPC